MIKTDVEVLSRYFSPDLLSKISRLNSVALSFSGGVDSSAVLVAMVSTLGPSKVTAYTFSSVLHVKDEMIRGTDLCSKLGVKQIVIQGPEQEDPRVMENHQDRCGICKRLRLELLRSICPPEAVLTDGTNGDDLMDRTRLGNKVILEFGIFSPLAEAGLSKKDVREMSKEMGIEWWNEPATACLATRFSRNQRLDPSEMAKVAGAERALRDVGFNVRIRALKEGAICLEFPPEQGEIITVPRKTLLDALEPYDFHRVMVDLEGYQVGRPWP